MAVATHSKAARLAAATRVSGKRYAAGERGRRRFHGRGKRGRVSTAADSALDCRLASDELIAAHEALLELDGRREAMTRWEFDRAVAAQMDKVRLASRLLDDLLLRRKQTPTDCEAP